MTNLQQAFTDAEMVIPGLTSVSFPSYLSLYEQLIVAQSIPHQSFSFALLNMIQLEARTHMPTLQQPPTPFSKTLIILCLCH